MQKKKKKKRGPEVWRWAGGWCHIRKPIHHCKSLWSFLLPFRSCCSCEGDRVLFGEKLTEHIGTFGSRHCRWFLVVLIVAIIRKQLDDVVVVVVSFRHVASIVLNCALMRPYGTAMEICKSCLELLKGFCNCKRNGHGGNVHPSAGRAVIGLSMDLNKKNYDVLPMLKQVGIVPETILRLLHKR